jgi:hypothetical protein
MTRRALSEEATSWVDAAIERLRHLSYVDLVALVDRHGMSDEHVARSGHELVLETTALWDEPKRRHVRVMVAVWWQGDPRWIKTPLVADDFSVAPDGAFIGEIPRR